MDILFTEEHKSEHSHTFGAICGKVEGVVSVCKWGLQILCVNAAHRTWKGGGRHFHTVEAALEHYKSPEMRAIIRASVEKAGAQ